MRHGKQRYLKPIENIRKEFIAHFQPSLLDLIKIETSEEPDSLFSKLEQFIKENVRGISSSQLRNLFDIVKVEQPDLSYLQLQRPRIAHMIAKQPREEAKFMIVLVDELIAQMFLKEEKNFAGFHYFLKCLLAFHKYYETIDLKRMKPESLLRDVEKDLKKVRVGEILKLYEEQAPVKKILGGLTAFLKKNSKGITSNQLRNVFNKILPSKDQRVQKLKLLKPELAYTATRQAREESVKFMYLVIALLEKVKTEKEKEAFIKVMEVIVSLHKFEEQVREKKIDKIRLMEETRRSLKPFTLEDLLSRTNSFDYGAIQEKLQELVLPKGAKEGLKSSQFRRLYDKVMMAETLQEFQLLSPFFLYTAARQSNEKAQKLILFFVDVLDRIKEDHFADFKILIFDLLAYHRYFEESKSTNPIPTIKKLTP